LPQILQTTTRTFNFAIHPPTQYSIGMAMRFPYLGILKESEMKREWKTYFLGFILLLIIEVCIALFVNDTVIRPFVGDMLVVLLVYCFVMTILLLTTTSIKITRVALGVLVFAFCVEALQATTLLHRIGLSENRLATVVLGSTFDWWDMVAYVAGTAVILILENVLSLKK
jgi:membrane-associated HD superfamily phosphohydrolase